jgi:hypothetical protein
MRMRRRLTIGIRMIQRNIDCKTETQRNRAHSSVHVKICSEKHFLSVRLCLRNPRLFSHFDALSKNRVFSRSGFRLDSSREIFEGVRRCSLLPLVWLVLIELLGMTTDGSCSEFPLHDHNFLPKHVDYLWHTDPHEIRVREERSRGFA